MKKIVLLLALVLPMVCSAQFINQDPHSKCKYKVGEIVLIPFDQMVSLWVFDSPNRVQDSLNARSQLILEYDTIEVKAEIIERFFIEEYGHGYYFVAVFNKKGEKIVTPIHRTSPTISAISERFLKKRPLTI